MKNKNPRYLKRLLLGMTLLFSGSIISQPNLCGSFCVTNVYFDSTNTMMFSIQYTGPNMVNYPYISTVYNSSGMPIASGSMSFFAQLPNTTLDYSVTTSLSPPLPPNFAGFIVFNFDTTTCQILFPAPCVVNNLEVSNEISREFKIFPNPTENVLYVNTPTKENYKIRILDWTGKIYTELPLDQHSKEIDCSFLSSGVYFAELFQGHHKLQYMKFIKH